MPSPAINLRTYTPADFEALYKIDQSCYEPEIAYSKRELRNYLRFPGAECVVAEEAEKIVGFILTAHAAERAHIITIDVVEEYRRRGVGTSLLAESEQRLAAQGVREVALETATDSESAIAFWQKHGYRTRGVWEGYYPGGRDAYAMTKMIAPRSRAARSSEPTKD
ncbi:MAG: N-acetyltransferase [Candidatus Acidiferrales bacterium]